MRIAAILCIAGLAAAAPRTLTRLTLEPSDPLLFGKGAQQTIIATARYSDGSEEDVTPRVRLRSEKPGVASVDSSGLITAEGNGGAIIRATYRGLTAWTTALVQRADAPSPPSFNADVMPVLTKIGCNGGSCHGALNGQNGFKLSLFGYEPEQDYDMIVQKHDGRRVNLPDPEKSLILLKPTFQVPHGGGKVLKKDSPEYNALLTWLKNGARRNPNEEKRIVALRVVPAESVLFGKAARRQLLVTARYSDGTERDITRTSKFQSNDDSIAKVSQEGVLTAERGG